MADHLTNRRGLLKAGTAVATAAPVAVLPKAEAAEQQDAALLELGRELETLWAREREFIATSEHLYALAERIRPAPAPELLAYQRDGRSLLERQENGRYRIGFRVMDEAADLERCWRILAFREGPCPEADVLAALERWRDGGEKAARLTGAIAADGDADQIMELLVALCHRIIAEPAHTQAGLKVKLRAMEWCHPRGSQAAAIKDQSDDEDERPAYHQNSLLPIYNGERRQARYRIKSLKNDDRKSR